ncbi:patatin-like phospholipase family protein [Myxococcus sp. CA051A]|uniref:patatin-like phospholipase family protein n=1 Tax=Myxococcus sp. CA051A TaxID=2741739 RepID=UPI00157B666B|nr:patatin-like phospholipase family protein [Myxococcus sp. CA051A]NTX62498.1 patatin-like phospholipase family protein [Myxococcus sp. CA051A]
MSKRRPSQRSQNAMKQRAGAALPSGAAAGTNDVLLTVPGVTRDAPRAPAWVTYLEKRLATVIALLAAGLALTNLPQVHNIVLQLPGMASLRAGGSALMAVTFWAYVVLLGAFFFLSAMWVFVPREGFPRWMEHRNLVSRATLALCRRLVAWARFPLAFPAPERRTPRALLYGGFVVAGLALGLVGFLGLLPAPWKARDSGPGLVAALTVAVGLLGLLGPRILAWRPSLRVLAEVVTRGLVMSLGSYFLAELLWGFFIPTIPEASFRLYTIWAIYHLLFVILCAARALDLVENVVQRAVLALALLGSGVVVVGLLDRQESLQPLPLAEGKSMSEDALFTRWVDTANRRLDLMCDGPVVFVSAAGGGSRAAIFAMLTLESLSRMQVKAPDATTERCRAQSLADHVLFISSVSGGSVASAHFSHRLAAGTLGATVPADVPLKHAPREELASHLMNGACGLKAERLWPLSSDTLDDMFVDFNAPLLRGVVMPGVSRGGGLASFWSDYLGWPASLPDDGSVPLLFINTASARTGGRIVTGKPPLPGRLVSDGTQPEAQARSTSELTTTGDIALADAVRASANFPFVVDLPEVVDAQEHREPLIDGGVFDNTGLDTFVLLLRGLTDPERWKTNPAARAAIDQLFTQLTDRGVLFVEIDSGAKPPSLDEREASVDAIGTPLSALSRASHAFARDMADYQKAEIGRLLASKQVPMMQTRYNYGDVRLSEDASKAQRECVEENQDEVMTAWALGPKDKGRLLGQFLWQEESASNLIASHIKNLRGAAQTQRTVAFGAIQDPVAIHAHPLMEKLKDPLARKLAAEITRQLVEDQVSLQRQGTARLYNPDAPAVQVFSQVDASAPDLATSLGDGRKDAWVYLGQYLPGSNTWRTCFYCKPSQTEWSLSPQQFVGSTLESTVPSLLRDEPATGEPAAYGKPLGALGVGQHVTVKEVQDWGNLGFIWAKVSINPKDSARIKR